VNFLSLFFDFILWVGTKRSVEAPILILVHESAKRINEHALARELSYDQCSIVETKSLPLLWAQKELALGGCPLTMYIEKVSDSVVHVKWVGDMRAFTGNVSRAPLSLYAFQRAQLN
jgi:hypothetical protein